MSLSPDPDRLLEEINFHEKAKQERLDGILDLTGRYPGAWWGTPPGPQAKFDSENASFEFVAHFMSQLVWDNPRWRATTNRPRAQQMVAQAIQHGMNRWTVDSNLKLTLEDAAVDYLFGWSVLHVTAQPRVEAYEAEDPVLWPQLSRLSIQDFGFDSRAPSIRRARVLYHKYRIDKEDLLEMATLDNEKHRSKREGWSLKSIRELNESRETERRTRSWAAGINSEGPDRNQVTVIEAYLPNYRLPNKPGPEEGFNGTICTLGVDADLEGSVELRPPRPFLGPRGGPYTVIGAYVVPDSPFPLSPLIANAGHIEQTSRLSKSIDSQVEAYKRLILVGAQDPILAGQIKNGKTDNVYFARMIQSLESLVKQLEMGGTTPPNLQAEARAISKRNRSLGLDDVQRGVTSGGDTTATEVSLAVEAAQGRQGYIRARFQDGVARAGRTVAWYLYHLNEITFPLGPDALEAMGVDSPYAEAFFEGGSHDDESGATFDDLGLDLEPYSMERQSDIAQQQRGQILMETIQLYPMLLQLGQAGADVVGLLDAIGEARGFPNLSKLFPGAESADPSVIQPDQARPRFGIDSGKAGAPLYHLRGGRGQAALPARPQAPPQAPQPQQGPGVTQLAQALGGA